MSYRQEVLLILVHLSDSHLSIILDSEKLFPLIWPRAHLVPGWYCLNNHFAALTYEFSDLLSPCPADKDDVMVPLVAFCHQKFCICTMDSCVRQSAFRANNRTKPSSVADIDIALVHNWCWSGSLEEVVICMGDMAIGILHNAWQMHCICWKQIVKLYHGKWQNTQCKFRAGYRPLTNQDPCYMICLGLMPKEWEVDYIN